MKKIFGLLVLLILSFLLARAIYADSWYNDCDLDCSQDQVDAVGILLGTKNFECCVACEKQPFDWNGKPITIEVCKPKWRELVSPISPISPLNAVVPDLPTPTEKEMPDWYYQPFGFPCEYLNPGNQDCICFCDAPMYCP